MRLIDAEKLEEKKFITYSRNSYTVGWNDAIDAIMDNQPTANDVILTDLWDLYTLVWDIDIPSPTVPEYREHHEQMVKLMKEIKEVIKKYE